MSAPPRSRTPKQTTPTPAPRYASAVQALLAECHALRRAALAMRTADHARQEYDAMLSADQRRRRGRRP